LREVAAAIDFWGAQAASLLFAAACREKFVRFTTVDDPRSAFGTAAECCRLAACAPQKKSAAMARLPSKVEVYPSRIVSSLHTWVAHAI